MRNSRQTCSNVEREHAEVETAVSGGTQYAFPFPTGLTSNNQNLSMHQCSRNGLR